MDPPHRVITGIQKDSGSTGLCTAPGKEKVPNEWPLLLILEKVNEVLTAFSTQLYIITILILVDFAHSTLVASGSFGCNAHSVLGTPVSGGCRNRDNSVHFTDEEPVERVVKATIPPADRRQESLVWSGSAFPPPGHAVFHHHLPFCCIQHNEGCGEGERRCRVKKRQ